MTGLLCAQCRTDNPPSAKFCLECGTSFQKRCPQCGVEPPVNAKFCNDCGTALAAPASLSDSSFAVVEHRASSIPPAESLPRAIARTERRQLTVLFCDIIGSTALAERLDPEDLHAVLSAYQQVSADAIQRYEGHIAKYLGDGLVVFFGYPQAHEDAAERAARAGLDMLEGIQRLNVTLQQDRKIELQVRIGIHTGLVVAGEMGAYDHKVMDIVGETPNIAARLQELAEPNSVVVSAATHHLIASSFDCQSLGLRAIKGLSRLMEVFRLLETCDSALLSSVQHPADSLLVGRANELQQLKARWEQARAGVSQVVFLSGEAGIGKSRLVHALRDYVKQQPDALTFEIKCSAHYQSSPFYPVISALQYDLAHLKRDDSTEIKIEKLEAFLTSRHFSVADTLPLLTALLSVPLGERFAPLNLSPEGQRLKTLDFLLNLVLKRAQKQPFLLILENIHWADPSTLEFLRRVIDQAVDVQLLLLTTFRTNFTPNPGGRDDVLHLVLDRLDDRETREIIARLSALQPLPDEVVRQIVAKTDGIPLFVEELTKMVLESGGAEPIDHSAGPANANEFTIPTTLNDSLMARLDRLSTVKEIAQVASVIGREFTPDLLQVILHMDKFTLQRELQRLVAADLMREFIDIEGTTIYRFKHALIQDAAYNSLLISRRQQYHQEIALTLEASFPETVENQPELLAYHYSVAGKVEPAFTYWSRAGQRALARFASQEAIMHYTRALELLSSLPDTLENLERELIVQANLGVAQIATRGFAAPEVERTYSRAKALCRSSGDTLTVFPILFGLWGYHLVSGQLELTLQEGEHLLRWAESAEEAVMLLVGNFSVGNASLWMGDVARAKTHLEQARALYSSEHHTLYVSAYSQDMGVSTLCFLSLALWQSGYPDQAVQRIEEAIDLARKTNHPFSLAWALGIAALVHYWRRDTQKTLEISGIAIAHCTEQGFPYFLSAAMIYRGWALFWQHRQSPEEPAAEGLSEGILLIRQGLAIYQATGSEICQPYLLGLLAEALGASGETQEGMQLLEQAFQKARTNGERISEVELYRLQGSLLLEQSAESTESGQSNLHEAERSYRQSIALARELGARSREHQAALALARLLKEQDRDFEAQEALAPIHASFTEGFATQDYQEATELLQMLAAK